jgi:hypothetical protein
MFSEMIYSSHYLGNAEVVHKSSLESKKSLRISCYVPEKEKYMLRIQRLKNV